MAKVKLMTAIIEGIFDLLSELLGVPFTLVAIFSVLSTPCILGYQVAMWLKYGGWLSIPTSVLFTNNIIFPKFCDKNPNICDWINDPQSWYGVHKIVTSTSLVEFLLILSIVLLFIVFGCFMPISDVLEKRSKRS